MGGECGAQCLKIEGIKTRQSPKLTHAANRRDGLLSCGVFIADKGDALNRNVSMTQRFTRQ
jgi:hypothetical protein